MQNFDEKLNVVEKILESIRGIFDQNDVKKKLEEIEKKFFKKIFGKIRN